MSVEIRAEGLGVRYGDVRVWEGIDLVIDEPGLVAILGPNGVGKSTFMYTINKLLVPTEGRVTLDGRDVQEMDYREIARLVAYVPQASNEAFSMTVMDTVLMGRYPHSGYSTTDEDLRIAADCMRMIGITDLAMRDFDELSAGQHQRVMIARGMAQEPQVLMLDEPTSNLDIYHQLHVMKMLRDIARERGIVILVICHDLNAASRYADRLILFSDGAIRADGAAEEVMTSENILDVYRVRADIVAVDGRPYAIFHGKEDPPADASDGVKAEEPVAGPMEGPR
ncbi:MAG: ABC transporter ATP-binding protein [Thermoplasmata archaeon]|nr:ABC transporter ATP-binding protein [Thermoplasmata archaeon]